MQTSHIHQPHMLDQLEHLTHTHKKHRGMGFYVKELFIFGCIFFIAFLLVTIFTNANLFLSELQASFTTDPASTSRELLPSQALENSNSISTIIDTQQAEDTKATQLLASYREETSQQESLAEDQNTLLSRHLDGYDFSFNTLPPTNRLIVEKFGVNDPIVVSKYTSARDFTNTNFNAELRSGVVKYPTTPDPGSSGNTLIFGHTSQERWKENPYGMVFANIAKFQPGDKIQIVWNGKLLEYKVIDIVVRYPQHVNEEYMKYAHTDKSYLTLMGCYPIGTAKQRMLVIAELVSSK